MDYDEISKQRPTVLCDCGKIRYVENPFCGCRPILKMDREKRTVVETDMFRKEEIWIVRIGLQ